MPRHRTAMVVAFLVIASARGGIASCEPRATALDEYATVDLVFSAWVTDIVEAGEMPGELTVRLDVSAVWKGAIGDTVSVAVSDAAYVGVPAVFGLCQEYLVYASNGTNGQPAVSPCGRTALLSEAAADVAALGEPTARSPVADLGRCGAVPGIVGTWWSDGAAAHSMFPCVKFRADGMCVHNQVTADPDLVVVVQCPYRLTRTVALGGEPHAQVLLGPERAWARWADVAGSPWQYLGTEPGLLEDLVYLLAPDGVLRAWPAAEYWGGDRTAGDRGELGVSYRRSDAQVYEPGPDGTITSVNAAAWGALKGLWLWP